MNSSLILYLSEHANATTFHDGTKQSKLPKNVKIPIAVKILNER